MTLQVAATGRLTSEQVRSALRAATLAPSTHNTQPWLFASGPGGIEVRADPDRILPVADADRRELLLSCGAALFNLRTAIHACGVHPVVSLFPRRPEPDLLAVVRPVGAASAGDRLARLAREIPRRHTNRSPFGTEVVPPSVVGLLRHAAELEQAWLPRLDHGQVAVLKKLVRTSHRVQMNDPAFLAEWHRWTARDRSSRDGVPMSAGGIAPADDSWVLRDFGTRAAGPSCPDLAPEPLVVVIGSFGDGPVDRLRTGQAMQRVLLTATALGLDASFISQPVEVAHVRERLRVLLGGGVWPQIILRLGHGSPASPVPRRELEEVVVAPTLLTA
ncbi:nitroreductase family protein [Amycolatopsis sp. NPDC049253]|uniref:Acg family FMN-binding oxidoreductase n=1 Tax=Amycolatopsis sp. NPDC049253 TaxID=3155274 RepID=UPI0034333792